MVAGRECIVRGSIDRSASFDEFSARILAALEVEASGAVAPRTLLSEELGLDSIHIYEMLLLIEASTGLTQPPDEEPGLLTLADAWEYFRRCWSVADGAQRSGATRGHA